MSYYNLDDLNTMIDRLEEINEIQKGMFADIFERQRLYKEITGLRENMEDLIVVDDSLDNYESDDDMV